MALAHIGPLTALLESLATAVGAGMLVGSFAIGTIGLIAGWSRSVLADRALADGYLGGACGVVIALIDTALSVG